MKRRNFIKIVSLTGGGLVLGSFIPLSALGKEEGFFSFPGDDPKGVFKPGPFLQIDSNGKVSIMMSRSEMGQGVYTTLPTIVAEELEVDWESIEIIQADAGFDYGSQATGGSTSVRLGYEPLRKAGATARVMLISAASIMLKEKTDVLYAESGFVISKVTGKKLSYGELAVEAGKLPVPADVPLKDPKDFKLIGKKIPRRDTPPKLFGDAIFGIDVRLPGMVYATIKRPTAYGLKVKSFDASSAKGNINIHEVFEISTGVAVVGRSTWEVFKAAEKIKVEWKETDTVKFSTKATVEEAYKKLNEPGGVIKELGDVDSILKTGKNIVEAVYEVPFLAHAPFEPMNCSVEIKNGKCEMWAPTQNPQRLRKDVAERLGIDQNDVTVHVTFLGGGFGRRLVSDFGLEAAEIAKKTGKPVKLTWTREDDMKHGVFRPFGVYKCRGLAGESGGIKAFEHHIVGQSIRQQWSKDPLKPDQYDFAEGSKSFPYNISDFKITGTILQTPLITSAFRAVYHSQVPFVVESFFDELAHSVKIDPFVFRRDMMQPGSRARAVLELAAEKAGWGKTLPPGTGMGIAFFEGYDSYCAEVATVSVVNNRIKLIKFVVAIDCGIVISPDAVKSQMEGAVIFALSAAMKGQITTKNGAVEQSNYDDYPILTFDESPEIEVHIVENTLKVGGVGEVGIGACAPALSNAIFAASGKRMRKLPILNNL